MNSKRIAICVGLGLALMFAGGGAAAQITGQLVNPDVMLVIDSSGSMDWLSGHPQDAKASWFAAQAACEAQDPNARTSWQKLQDVMLGSIPADEFHCMVEVAADKTRPGLESDTVASNVLDNIQEYREVPWNHYRAVACAGEDWSTTYKQCVSDPSLGSQRANDLWCGDGDLDGDGTLDWDATNQICYNPNPDQRERRANGILDRYSSLVRFGAMTYDNKPAPAAPGLTSLADPHEGLWDHGLSRKWRCKEWYYGETAGDLSAYPACTWNAGARTSNLNAVGRLVPISDDMAQTNAAVGAMLRTTEPLYCSPMGALLDDVGYYFHNDPNVKSAEAGGNDRYFNCRPKLVIFISDGQPTPAFEFPQDYCDEEGDNPLPPTEAVDPDAIYRCPWNSSSREVDELFSLVDPAEAAPILSVVIGFNVPDVDCATQPDECVQVDIGGTLLTPRAFLDNLAAVGWPDDPNVEPPPWRPPLDDEFTVGDDPDDNCPTAVCGSGYALFVETPEQLSAVLDMVLAMVTTTTVTRTEVATTDQTHDALNLTSFSDKEVAQYEFNSGYATSAGQPWRGYLYRQGYSCASDTSEGGAVDAPIEIHELLNAQSDRSIYTLPPFTSDASKGLPSADDYPGDIPATPAGYDGLVLLDDVSLNDCDFDGPLLPDTEPDRYQLCANSDEIQLEVKKHIYGLNGSEREHHRLADIYNSSPAILGPPMERLMTQSYQEFKSSYLPGSTEKRMMERAPFLFVGTSDGVLHAFNVWADGTNDYVPEAWGYIPSPLLPTLASQYPIAAVMHKDADDNYLPYTLDTSGQYQHIFGVDGSPLTQDVRLYRLPNMPLETETKLWRSVVLGGLGKGGRGYYALDVTNPEEKPTLRFEISPDSSANNPPGPPDAPESGDPLNPETFDAMGLPVAKPAIAYTYFKAEEIPGESGTNIDAEVALAILPGGYIDDPSRSTGVYLVRVADGALIRYLDPSNDDDICRDPVTSAQVHPALTAQLVGEPGVPAGSRSTLIAKEAYIGDDRGRLWRIDLSGDLSGDLTEEWCLEMYFDTLLTSHFPYKDCLTGTDACCTNKLGDATQSCTAGEMEDFASDTCFGVECCTGLPCADTENPHPRIPIVMAPTIAQDRDRNNIVIFGTGQIDGLETLDHHRIFSVTDRIIFNVAGGRSYHDDPQINWWLGEEMPDAVSSTDAGIEQEEQEAEMADTHIWFVDDGSPDYDFYNLGEKLLGRVVVFNEVAYFTTFVPTAPDADDACDSGGTRIWGVDYASRLGDDGAWQDVIEENDFGKFQAAGGEDGGSGEGAYAPFIEYAGELISGIKVVRRPACTGEPTFQLVAQRVNSTPGSSSPPPADQPQIKSVTIPIQGASIGFATVTIDSWSLVFN